MTGDPILVAGPTASGKSALALALAREVGGVVVNADSMQVYAEWRVLTARPSAQEEASAPHNLYGHVALAHGHSVGQWLREVAPVLADARQAGRRAILVGGTGLFFTALTRGLAPIPEIPGAVRAEAEALLAHLGTAGLAARLAEADPDTAATIDRENPVRLIRAWEVLEATGTGMAAWRRRTAPPLVPLGSARPIVLDPPRHWLAERIATRFDAMLEGGALEEAKAVAALDLPPATPGLKALGAPELMASLAGHMTLAEAREAAITGTRRYAKRQSTWMRNQLGDWPRIDPSAPGWIARTLSAAARA